VCVCVCVDTTCGAEPGRHWFDGPRHWAWLEDTFSSRDVIWLVPFCHHPAYHAGPDTHRWWSKRSGSCPFTAGPAAD
jgi:hypothetical protein